MELFAVVFLMIVLIYGDDIIKIFKDKYRVKAVYFPDSSTPLFEKRRVFVENMLRLGVSSEDAEKEATRLFGKKL